MLIPGFIKSHLLFSLQCSCGCCTRRPFGLQAERFALTPLASPRTLPAFPAGTPPLPQPLAAGLPKKEGRLGDWKKGTNFSCSQITTGRSSEGLGCLLRLLMCWRLLLSISRGSPGTLWLWLPDAMCPGNGGEAFNDWLKLTFLFSPSLAPSTKYNLSTWWSTEVQGVRKRGTRRFYSDLSKPSVYPSKHAILTLVLLWLSVSSCKAVNLCIGVDAAFHFASLPWRVPGVSPPLFLSTKGQWDKWPPIAELWSRVKRLCLF